MKLFQLLLSLTLISACSHQVTVPTSQPPQAQVINPVVPVLDQWQGKTLPNQDNLETDLWQRIIDAYGLKQDVDNARIRSQLNWYKKHQSYMDRVATRAQRYMYYIAEQIDVRDIPGELALLPIVESAFDPFAYSHGRASGVWQFIPSTGRDFGLT